jgi:hypothetical protein
MVDDFSDMCEWLDVRESVSEIDDRLFGVALSASRSGMMMRTCWQTTSEGINLRHGVSFDNGARTGCVTYHPAGAKNLLISWIWCIFEYVKAIQSGVPGRLKTM